MSSDKPIGDMSRREYLRWHAEQERAQKERDRAAERAHAARAADEQRKIDEDDKAAVKEFRELLGKVAGMSDADVAKAIKRYGRRTGRRVMPKDRERIRRAQGKKRRWWQ